MGASTIWGDLPRCLNDLGSQRLLGGILDSRQINRHIQDCTFANGLQKFLWAFFGAREHGGQVLGKCFRILSNRLSKDFIRGGNILQSCIISMPY